MVIAPVPYNSRTLNALRITLTFYGLQNCCFKCSSKGTAEILEEDAYALANEALQFFLTIKVLVITGGECT
jgi:hypothetical protein